MEFGSTNSDDVRCESNSQDSTWRPKYYFAYDTLMDTEQAQRVLHRRDRPTLFHATLEGWPVKMWGEYPALVHQKRNAIYGRAIQVTTRREGGLLKQYEMDRSMSQVCLVDIEGTGECVGWMFKWIDDPDGLRHGNFDLEDWRSEQVERKGDSTGSWPLSISQGEK